MTDADKIARLAALPNIGEKSAGWMIEVGVDTPETLAELGAVETYARMKAAYPRDVSLCALWALHGAIEGVHYAKLAPEVKDTLKDLLAARAAAG